MVQVLLRQQQDFSLATTPRIKAQKYESFMELLEYSRIFVRIRSVKKRSVLTLWKNDALSYIAVVCHNTRVP